MPTPIKFSTLRKKTTAAWATSLLLAALASQGAQAHDNDEFKFQMVRSPALAAFPSCLPDARATVRVESHGAVEEMRVKVEGLPPDTDFDFFVIQVPNAPFGMAWYQGDIETNRHGRGEGFFLGRFSEETFIVAPNSAAAPSVHNNAFPDATLNPKTGPIHTFHLGLWFNSAQDAAKAGCPGNVTPFNGEHNAGAQVLNTSGFPDLAGPLLKVKQK
jgi:hypothetical protein